MKPEQITAWALNELPPEETAALENAFQENPQALNDAQDARAFCDMLTRELRDESLALAPDQRSQLQGIEVDDGMGHRHPACAGQAGRLSPMLNGQVTPAQPRPHHGWSRQGLAGLAAAACVTLLAWMGMKREVEQQPELRVSGKEGELPAIDPASTVRVMPGGPEVEMRHKVQEKKRANGGNTQPPVNPVLAQDEITQKLALAKTQTELGNFDDAQTKYEEVLRMDPYNVVARRGMEVAEHKRSVYFESAGVHQRARMLNMVDESWESGAGTINNPLTFPDFSGGFGVGKPAAPSAPQPLPTLIAGTSNSGNLVLSAGNVTGSTTTLEKTGAGSLTSTGSLAIVDAPADAYRAGRNDTSGESYTRIVENGLLDVQREPLSTFSIDVDTASYANVRRFLNQNTRPPPDAVRIEELVNYFPASEEGPPPGAEHPFAVKVEISSCPWQPQHRLARVHLQARDIGRERPASNLVFLVDVSGSMSSEDKLPLVRRSLLMLAERLGENDRVSMVTYASGTQVVLPSVNGLQKADIISAVDRLQAGGSTHGSAGIRLAYEQAVAGFIQGGVNRVILCTDGDFNVGISDPAELEGFITEKASSGVFLSVLGFGTGNLKDRTMETLADKGNGNYAYIDSLGEARKVLVEQMNGTLVTVAKDVKIQIEFNPVVVRQYRLIGYENRLLAKEDFNNDTKDAGEIGAGHNVIALYELVPASLSAAEPQRPLVDSLKYQRQLANPPVLAATPAAAGGEAMTVKLRYKEPDGAASRLLEVPVRDAGAGMEQAGDEFQFSAAVAGFGLLLRGSSYAGQLTWEQVRELALKGKGADPLGYRGEFIQLIEKARGLSGDAGSR